MNDLESLISSFNSKQRILAGLNIVVGIIGYSSAYLFFRYAPEFACTRFDLEINDNWYVLGSILVIIILTATALKARANGRESLEYEDSIDHSLLNSMRSDPTNGSVVVDHYASRVTAPAFALTGLFLSGPNGFLGCKDRLARVIENPPEAARTLGTLLARIKSVGKWHSVSSYLPEILRLIRLHQLDLIELDLRKGRLKASAQRVNHS